MIFNDEYSQEVTDKFIKLCNEGIISQSDELRYLKHIEDRYKPIPLAVYAKNIVRNYKLVKRDFKKGILSGFKLGGKDFIYSEIN